MKENVIASFHASSLKPAHLQHNQQVKIKSSLVDSRVISHDYSQKHVIEITVLMKYFIWLPTSISSRWNQAFSRGFKSYLFMEKSVRSRSARMKMSILFANWLNGDVLLNEFICTRFGMFSFSRSFTQGQRARPQRTDRKTASNNTPNARQETSYDCPSREANICLAITHPANFLHFFQTDLTLFLHGSRQPNNRRGWGTNWPRTPASFVFVRCWNARHSLTDPPFVSSSLFLPFLKLSRCAYLQSCLLLIQIYDKNVFSIDGMAQRWLLKRSLQIDENVSGTMDSSAKNGNY